ncbi:Do family serine endopeptidase [Reichenbachiella carrageenanivorans]|uniref:Do family serine endopeptidase n=1 Tax=Reichenbachiella carrageenanivorans TaxID=2979869 RepID=A0ABY6D8V6_9BACT|nr:Do family serine endopeptidase [Reichenbachiella carrageenanivorans]UXX80315.1 Do family serine endopeptidase [Reichenbachiella carrageenanivorans]
MNNRQFFIKMVFASMLGGFVALGGYHMIKDEPVRVIQSGSQPVRFSNYDLDSSAMIVPEGLNFVYAAKAVTPGVVHIRSTFEGAAQASRGSSPFDQYFKEFFGDPHGGQSQQRPSMGTGSGVIISADGYIATNNHVIENATEIEVLLNDNRTYKAEIVGTDPTTDLALLKVEEKGLPFIKVGNSDQVQVGEWVLAVGNPFEFRSTVTAGIISAKGRNINILRNRNNLQIESFLQTDAAVNPGNSGGALVNLRGELVGINTAIATPTGTYAGYSFAVPSNLVNKVLDDLKEFGVVQRALLGINIRDVNSQLAEEEGLNVLEGVYVINVNPNSGADDAGIEKGDVIIAVGGEKVVKTSELQEKVALNRPGDKVKVTLIRDGKEKTVTATLKNTLGTTTTVASSNNMTIQGGTFSDLSKENQEKLGLEGGAKLLKVEAGKWREAGIKEGFIVTRVDKRQIMSVEDLSRALTRTADGSGLLIEGMYEDGEKAYYGIGW